MSNLLYILILINLWTVSVFAQAPVTTATATPAKVSPFPPVIEKFQFQSSESMKSYVIADTTGGLRFKALDMKPGAFTFENSTAPRLLNDFTIVQVDLVYSDYPAGDDFSELNKKRLNELYTYCPNAFTKNAVYWRIVRQTGVRNGNDLKAFFHGFVIYYRPLPSFADEKKMMMNIITGKDTLRDSTVYKIFKRNEDKWKEMLCVVDVTGSMAPYTIQLLVWAKMNEKLKSVKQFVFFNDNEENSNDQSKARDTFGIWDIESFKADKILDKMLWSMNSGAHYENNLEAVFYAAKKYPKNIKNIIMIADNWEDPCDMKLLPQLKKLNVPIRIIICGIENGVVNTNYLDIARATNGSIHTMEDDLTEMGKLTEGKTFKILGMTFKLTKGKFVRQK